MICKYHQKTNDVANRNVIFRFFPLFTEFHSMFLHMKGITESLPEEVWHILLHTGRDTQESHHSFLFPDMHWPHRFYTPADTGRWYISYDIEKL